MRAFATAGQMWQQAAEASQTLYSTTAAAAAAKSGSSPARTPAGAGEDMAQQLALEDTSPAACPVEQQGGMGEVADTPDQAHSVDCGLSPELDQGRGRGLGASWGVGAGAGAGLGGSWQQLAHVAAAHVHALGYEGGVWDLLGSITVGRRALDALAQLPGVGTY
ncbi:hypothetical protein V8C86DRAFT_3128777 [Haematococcus lacustris]